MEDLNTSPRLEALTSLVTQMPGFSYMKSHAYIYFLACCVLCFGSGLLYASQTKSKPTLIKLDSNYQVLIESCEDQQVSVTMLYGEPDDTQLVRKYTFGAAVVLEYAYSKIQLDHDPETQEYLITIWNSISNYGAKTGIIIYKDSYWWNMFVVPSDKFNVADSNGDNVADIVLEDKKYSFENGVLVPLVE